MVDTNREAVMEEDDHRDEGMFHKSVSQLTAHSAARWKSERLRSDRLPAHALLPFLAWLAHTFFFRTKFPFPRPNTPSFFPPPLTFPFARHHLSFFPFPSPPHCAKCLRNTSPLPKRRPHPLLPPTSPPPPHVGPFPKLPRRTLANRKTLSASCRTKPPPSLPTPAPTRRSSA